MQRVHEEWSTAPATPFRRTRAASLERAAQVRSDPLMVLLFMARGMCLSCLAWLVIEAPTPRVPEAEPQSARPMFCAQ